MDAIEFRDLRWMIAISRHRSLRAAANVLNVRQSTLSRRMSDLEHRLGVVLFERGSRGTCLTAVGEEFLKTANHIVSEMDSRFFWLSAYARKNVGRLAIGVYAALSAGNLRTTITEYHNNLPKIEIQIRDGTGTGLLSALAAGDIDIAILTGSWPDDWNDQLLPLWTERVVAAIPEPHPLVPQPFIQWTELKAETLLLNRRVPGQEFSRLLSIKMDGANACHVVEQDAGIDRLLSLVGMGLGLTLVLEGATGASYPGVVYREVRDEAGPSRMSFVACWRQANSNPALRPFLDLLRERYPDLLAKPAKV